MLVVQPGFSFGDFSESIAFILSLHYAPAIPRGASRAVLFEERIQIVPSNDDSATDSYHDQVSCHYLTP